MLTPSEHTPLLQDGNPPTNNEHTQFCMLVGVPPSNLPPKSHFSVGPKSLYGRATRQHSTQQLNYVFTATLSNSLLLAQVVLSAALTALGASESSHILITIFGVLNTIIAGVVAWLKSRGQPMRSRMYRDDLERVVDEIENSETMWLGISGKCHGYGEIDVDDKVTVRSEVARLTRLYDHAVRSNTMNNPDMYMASAGGDVAVALRARPDGPRQGGMPRGISGQAVPVVPGGAAAAPIAAPPPPPEDESPATAPSKPTEKEPDKDKKPEETAKKDEDKATPATKDPSAASPADPSKPPDDGGDKSKEPSNNTATATGLSALPPLAPGSVAAAPDDSPATAVDPGRSKKKEKETESSKDGKDATASKEGATSNANHEPDEIAGAKKEGE